MVFTCRSSKSCNPFILETKPENVLNVTQIKFKFFYKVPLTITYLLQFTITIYVVMRSNFSYYSLALIDSQYDATLSFLPKNELRCKIN